MENIVDRPMFKLQAATSGLAFLNFYEISLESHQTKPRVVPHSEYFDMKKGEELRLLNLGCHVTALEDFCLEIKKGREKRIENTREVIIGC